MYCIKCGAEIEDNSIFCKKCGEKVVADQSEFAETKPVFEADIVSEDTQYIQQADTVQFADYPSPETEIPEIRSFDMPEIPAEKPKKKWVGKLIACVSCVAVLAVAGFFGYKFFFGNKDKKIDYSKHPIIYLKDDQLMIRDYNKNSSFKLADDVEDYYSNVRVSDDGSRIFFLEEESDDDEYTYKLYYRNRSDGDKVKIANDVEGYMISPDGKYVLYVQDEKIYFSNLKDKKSLCAEEDFRDCAFSNDSKKLILLKNNGILYMRGVGMDDENEKIDKDVESAAVVGDAIYVLKKDSELYFDDLIEDDLADEDADIKYPSESDFSSYDGYYGYRKVDWDAYYEAEEKYEAKEKRDNFRENYEDDAIFTTYSLYKTDGKKSVKISEGIISDGYMYSGMTLKTLDLDDKILMSEIDESYFDSDYYYNTQEIFNVKPVWYIGGKQVIDVSEIGDYQYWSVRLSDSGKYLYYMDKVNTLHQCKMSSDGIEEDNEICDDARYFYIDEDTVAVYNNKNELGVYKDGDYTKLSDNVRSAGWYNSRNGGSGEFFDGALYYIDDYNEEERTGDLVRYKDGKKKRIDRGVTTYSPRSGNVCYYIKEYDREEESGKLYKFDGKKTEKIDSKVKEIIH